MRFLLIILLPFILCGCYQKPSSLTDTLIYCVQSTPKTFNPQISNDQATLDATTHQLFNRLVKTTHNNKIKADLATNWVISEDKKSYTFYLRDDVFFHQTPYFTPTRRFNADDVLFSFNRLIDTQSSFHAINSEHNNYFFNHPFKNLIKNIVKVDQYTIKIILKAPFETFLLDLSSHYAVIHSQEYAQQLIAIDKQNTIDFLPIGTGPYKFVSNNQAGVIHYKKHQKYWETSPNLDEIIYVMTKNNNKRYAKLLSGECDVMTTPAASQINVIESSDLIQVHNQQTNNIMLLAFNTANQTFANQYIRQAFSYAVDQKGIIDAIFFESGTPANGLLLQDSWAYDKNNPNQYYAPQVALRLLKEHNFNFSQSIKMLLPIQRAADNPTLYKTAKFIQNNLKSIGVKINLQLLNSDNIQLFLASGNYDLFVTNLIMDKHEPHDIFHALLGCDVDILEGNSSQWCDQKIDSLITSALHAENQNLSKMRYYQIQELIQDLRPYYSIAHEHRVDISYKNISGLVIDPITGINFQHVNKTRR